MKRFLFLAIAAAFLLHGCATDDNLGIIEENARTRAVEPEITVSPPDVNGYALTNTDYTFTAPSINGYGIWAWIVFNNNKTKIIETILGTTDPVTLNIPDPVTYIIESREAAPYPDNVPVLEKTLIFVDSYITISRSQSGPGTSINYNIAPIGVECNYTATSVVPGYKINTWPSSSWRVTYNLTGERIGVSGNGGNMYVTFPYYGAYTITAGLGTPLESSIVVNVPQAHDPSLPIKP